MIIVLLTLILLIQYISQGLMNNDINKFIDPYHDFFKKI